MTRATLVCLGVMGVALLMSRPALAVEKGAIEVKVYNLRSNEGMVIISLYHSAAAFPYKMKEAFKVIKAKIRDGKAAVRLSEIPYGSYAIQVTHDRNSNGKTELNFMGIPTEPVGTSNNPNGIATFKLCKFEHKAPVTKIKPIKVRVVLD